MPTIKPISDLRSYSSVLDTVSVGAPVFLTKNGRGRYVILDIQDYERIEAEETLLNQLNIGMRSISERGVISDEQVSAMFESRFK